MRMRSCRFAVSSRYADGSHNFTSPCRCRGLDTCWTQPAGRGENWPRSRSRGTEAQLIEKLQAELLERAAYHAQLAWSLTDLDPHRANAALAAAETDLLCARLASQGGE